MQTIRNYDSAKGQAFQGDVCFFRVPADIAKHMKRNDEVAPLDVRLIPSR